MSSRISRSIFRVRQSYPELDGYRIRGHFTGDDTCYMQCAKWGEEYLIEASSRRLFKAPDIVLDAIMAHELGHALDWHLNNFWATDFNAFLRRFRPWEDIEEKRVDKIAVERGYGRELIYFMDWVEKMKLPWEKQGLTKEEIEVLLRKAA